MTDEVSLTKEQLEINLRIAGEFGELNREIERLCTEDARKQGVINALCGSHEAERQLLCECLPHIPQDLKDRMADLGVVDIEDTVSGRQT